MIPLNYKDYFMFKLFLLIVLTSVAISFLTSFVTKTLATLKLSNKINSLKSEIAFYEAKIKSAEQDLIGNNTLRNKLTIKLANIGLSLAHSRLADTAKPYLHYTSAVLTLIWASWALYLLITFVSHHIVW